MSVAAAERLSHAEARRRTQRPMPVRREHAAADLRRRRTRVRFHVTAIRDSVRHYHRETTEVYYILEGRARSS